MEETTFLNEAGVLVTSTRIEVGGQTFATRNVGSVKVEKRGRPVLAGVVAFVGLSVSIPAKFSPAEPMGLFGWGLMLLAAYMLWERFSKASLVLVSGGGETTALRASNATIERVRVAVANAIAAR